jgi:hypothetical protein
VDGKEIIGSDDHANAGVVTTHAGSTDHLLFRVGHLDRTGEGIFALCHMTSKVVVFGVLPYRLSRLTKRQS